MNDPAVVVCVDDEPDMLEVLEGQLFHEGYELKLYSSDKELLEDQPVLDACDIVLLDVMMPLMDGIEVTEQLRKRTTRFLPVLLVTALGGSVDKMRGLDAGATDFIVKPTNGTELRARVRAHLRTKQLHDELASAHEELKELGELRDELIDMIVHDLRNPLTAVHMALQVLALPEGKTPQGDNMSEIMDSQLNYAIQLCDQLLDIKLLQAGKLVPDKSIAQIGTTVEQALASLHLQAQGKGVWNP